MRAHYLQHVPFEGMGSIAPWLQARGYDISCTRLYRDEPLPPLAGIDLLIVMGGPMSVNNEDLYPWLVQEKQFIRRAIDGQIPLLGICLGAQLIANALGAKVYPGAEKEIGWFPIEGIPESPLQFPSGLEAFHWHGETFDLPKGAVRLARSEGCHNQAFLYGDRVVGLQFHLETTPESLKDLVDNCRDELQPGAFIQSEKELLDSSEVLFGTICCAMDTVLHFLTEKCWMAR